MEDKLYTLNVKPDFDTIYIDDSIKYIVIDGVKYSIEDIKQIKIQSEVFEIKEEHIEHYENGIPQGE